MKKILLLLSCFLATWCSVQAASGSITSATYNASNSTFNVSYTSSGANSVYMDVICMRTGPVSRVTLNSGSASKTINLPITSRDGEYDLVLYVNGTPCYDKKVTVSKYGHLDKVTASSAGVVTINYTMLHAETDNYPSKSYLKIGNARHNITNVKNGSYTWKNLKLTEGQTYTCEIYVDGKKLDFGTFTVPDNRYGHINNVYDISKSSVTVNYTMRNAKTNNCYLKIGNYKSNNIKNGEKVIYKWTGLNLPAGKNTCEIYVDGKWKHSYVFTVPNETVYVNMIPKLTYTGGSLKIDFTLRDTGVNLGFRVHAVSMSGNTGETKTYDYGRYYQHEGTYTVPVPRYSGQVIYAVELLVDGISVDGNSIQVY